MQPNETNETRTQLMNTLDNVTRHCWNTILTLAAKIDSKDNIPAYADRGDSGGPLACPGDGDDMFLAGVTHTALPIEKSAMLYTMNHYYRTAPYLDWINAHISDDSGSTSTSDTPGGLGVTPANNTNDVNDSTNNDVNGNTNNDVTGNTNDDVSGTTNNDVNGNTNDDVNGNAYNDPNSTSSAEHQATSLSVAALCGVMVMAALAACGVY